VAAGSAAEVLPLSLSCPLPILRTPPPPFASLLLVHGDGSKQYSIRTLEVNLFLFRKQGGKSHFGINLVSAILGV